MAYKNHHYIPRFYLKNFSLDGRKINVYTTKGKNHFKGSLKNQCSKKNFYDDEKTEKFLSIKECEQSKILKKIIQEKENFPTISSNENFLKILEFLSLTGLRTLYFKKIMDSFKEALSECIYIEIPKNKMNLKDIKRNLCVHILLKDLKPILLFNKTQTEFLSSDNPVALHRSLNTFGGDSFNFGSKGLMVFCPLTPHLVLMLFDKKTYKVNKGRSKRLKEKDVKEINKLQFLSSFKCLFYFSDNQKKNIESLHKEIGDLGNKPYIEVRNPILGDKYSNFPPKININFKFIKSKVNNMEFKSIRSEKLSEEFKSCAKNLI